MNNNGWKDSLAQMDTSIKRLKTVSSEVTKMEKQLDRNNNINESGDNRGMMRKMILIENIMVTG